MRQGERPELGPACEGLAPRWLRLIAGAVAIAALAVLLFTGVLSWRGAAPLMSKLDQSAHLLLWVGWSLIALLIVWRGHPTRGNAALALAMGLIGLNRGLSYIAEAWPRVQTAGFEALAHLETALAAAAYVRAAQLFPNPLTREELERPEAPWRRVGWMRHLLRAQLDPRLVWGVWGGAVALAALIVPDAATWPISVPIILLGVAYWHAHFRVGDAQERRQVSWFLLTAILFALFAVLRSGVAALLSGPGLQPWRAAGLTVFDFVRTVAILSCVFLAIFRAGAVSPDLIIRRAVVYGAAVALLITAFNVIQSILVDSAVEAFGVNDRFVSALLGTLAGLAFEPLTDRLKALFDRYAPDDGAPAGRPSFGRAEAGDPAEDRGR